MPNAYMLTALSDSHEKNAFFAFPSQNAMLIAEIRFLLKNNVFRRVLWAQPFWISRAHLSCMMDVVAKVDSGEKTLSFVDVYNATYLGIKLIEVDTHDEYSM